LKTPSYSQFRLMAVVATSAIGLLLLLVLSGCVSAKQQAVVGIRTADIALDAVAEQWLICKGDVRLSSDTQAEKADKFDECQGDRIRRATLIYSGMPFLRGYTIAAITLEEVENETRLQQARSIFREVMLELTVPLSDEDQEYMEWLQL